MRQIVTNLERLKLPSKHSGVTGESRHGSEDTARRPPSVKAALSVSFGQRAPHRASTRDSSPVRRALPPPHDRDRNEDPRRSPISHRSQSREEPDRDRSDRERDRDRDRDRHRERDRDRERNRDRERDWDRDRDRRHGYDRHEDRERDSHRSRYSDRESSRRDYERSSRDSSRHGDSVSRRSRTRSRSRSRTRSRSRSRSRSLQVHGTGPDRCSSPFWDGSKEKASVSSNMAKLKDLYGDGSDRKEDGMASRSLRDTGGEEVIRLGGSTWK